MKKLCLASAVFAFLSLIFLLPVLAVSNQGSPEKNKVVVSAETRQEKAEDVLERVASRSALRKEKLETKKLKVCETLSDNIKRRSQSIVNRSQNQLDIFNDIVGRVETFYNTKMVPKGITVSSYNSLVADIANQKTAVNTAVATAKTDADNFSCTGNDPKGRLANFHIDTINVINALKTYRKSIRNLIVAVKTSYNAASTATSSARSNHGQ